MEEETSLSNAATSSLPLTNIYLCHLCDKPYVSESSRQRHLRYCGSRVRKRPRSCRACNAAKTKCSFDTPCSRCMKKGIECSYVVSPKEGSRALPTTSRSDEVVMSLADVASVDREPVDNDIFVQSFEINGSLQADLSMQPFIFDEPFNIDGFTVLQDYITNPPPCLPDNSLAHLSKLDQKAPSWCTWSRGGVSTLLVMSDTSIVERDSEMNMFAMIKTYKPHAQHNANLIIQALRALPTMMLRRNTFPWFIHSHAHLLSNPPKTSLPEALSTCMSISHMFASRMPETRPFLWCTIRAEYRRFINEMYNMSQYELLAAIQACMVYLIMCIVDQSPESEQNSLELLMAIHNLYVLFKEVGTGWTRLSELSHPSSNWEEWIFAESQRRLAHLWFLIGCVVCLKTGIPCDPSQSFRALSLPGLKSLWEARSQTDWEVEHEATLNLQASGLATLGDLVDAQQAAYLPANAQKLDKWNAGVDNLGSMLNLVGTMV